MSDVQYHALASGLRLAYRHASGAGPTLVFLPGYMSDMEGGKATAVFEKAEAEGRACLLLDYSGCGASEGDFANGTLSRWRDEVLELINLTGSGAAIIIGSSMGGWLMLMVAEALGQRVAGMVGIASAPDFTEWGRSEADKAKLTAGETIYDDNPYGPEPTPMHPGFFADGQAQLMLDREINIPCPVRLLHGQRDADVPWEITMKLSQALRSDDIQICLVKDGDHRLSREQDIDLLLRQVWSLLD
ncbi:MAG: alpha/beta hydrolase [Sphingomonadales bacterium]|nr:MAG: alpha/beta hydrolase [Sphingomonadales bacterium]